MSEAIDEIAENAERELKFRFKTPDFCEMKVLFAALEDFGRGFELISSKGIVWTPKDSDHLLRRYFGEPGATHTFRARKESDIRLYKSVFENFPEYVEYE
jgi:hypothetical protein